MIDVSAVIPVVSTASAISGKVADRSGAGGRAAALELNVRRDIAAGNEVSLEKLAEALDKFVPKDLPNTRLQIVHDDGAGQFVYKAVDQDSGEVVRQYPSEDILKFISYYREQEGLLVDGTA